MDVRELFAEALYEVPIEIEGKTLTFAFRNPTVDEELEFRRRSSRQNARNDGSKMVIEPSDAALKAPLWHFDHTCVRITLANGTGETNEVPKSDWCHIPEDMKNTAWISYRNRFQRKENSDLQD